MVKFKGCKKICNSYDTIIKAMRDYDPRLTRSPMNDSGIIEIENDDSLVYYEPGRGMNGYMISHLARKMKVHVWMRDCDGSPAAHWEPDGCRHNSAPAIAFNMMNVHFYPILNKQVPCGQSSRHISSFVYAKKDFVKVEYETIQLIKADDSWNVFFSRCLKQTFPDLGPYVTLMVQIYEAILWTAHSMFCHKTNMKIDIVN